MSFNRYRTASDVLADFPNQYNDFDTARISPGQIRDAVNWIVNAQKVLAEAITDHMAAHLGEEVHSGTDPAGE